MRKFCIIIIVICTGFTIGAPNDKDKIYVVNHGWHTTIVISSEKSKKYMPFLSKDFIDSDYFEFGWGDFKYYQEENPGKILAARALFLPTGSIMHVVSFEGRPELNFIFSDLVSLKASEEQIKNLCKTINSYFKRNDYKVIKLNQGLYGNSYFYKSRGVYSAINNCNTWTTAVLSKSGIPVKSFATFTSASVMKSIRDSKHENKL